jgi:hypothetical protein
MRQQSTTAWQPVGTFHRDRAPYMKQQATRHASWSDNQTTVSSEGMHAALRQGKCKARQVQGKCKASARHNTKPAGGCNQRAPSEKNTCWRLYQRAPSQVHTCRSLRKLAGGCISERPARKMPAGGCISERPARHTYTCRWITPEQDQVSDGSQEATGRA